MVWRKQDNWTAFTDGYRTWISGPNGLESRLNTERLPWEVPPVPSPIAAQWKSPNCWPGPRPGPGLAIVGHTESGYEAGAVATFLNPASQVSAHFGVSLAGKLDQFVPLGSMAWANGWIEEGSRWFEIYKGPRDGDAENPNRWTYSFETEDKGDPNQPVTDEEYLGAHAACRLILAFDPHVRYLMTHRSISPRSRPNCPGRRWVESGRFAQLADDLGLIPII